MSTNEVVYISAAAGGVGSFAVQLAKAAGNHVIGSTSRDEKIEYLRAIGCDRPINYKKEDIGAVLKKEYPGGVNIAYDTAGGTTSAALLII